MTWTLRFYDREGTEIGYAEKLDRDTYNAYSESDDFRETLESYSSLLEDDNFGMNDPAWTVNHGPIETRRRPSEEHLRMVQERFSHPEVAKTTLRDE